MTEPAREGKVLALLEAEFRAADPGLAAQFDAFASRSPVLGAPPPWDAGQDHWRTLAKRLLTFLLVPLTVMTVLLVLSGSAPVTRSPGGVAGLERRLVTPVEVWAARQGQTIRARICQSIPAPARTVCG